MTIYQSKYCPKCKKNETKNRDICTKCGSHTIRKGWCVRFYFNGKQVRLSGYATRNECVDAYNNYKPNENITVEELFNLYMEHRKQTLKPQSYRNTFSPLKLYVLPYFGKMHLKDLKPLDIEQWKQDINKKDISFNYKDKIYTSFNTMINYAIQMEIISHNVVKRVGNFKNQEKKKEMLFWTEEEFLRFYSAIQEDPIYKAFFSFLYFMGTRKGEALALNWKDINGNVVDINKSITRKGVGDCGYLITTPKNKASYRKILMPNNLIDIMNEYKEYCKTFDGWSEDSFVFGIARPLAEETIRRKLKHYSNIAKIKEIRVHDLRHSHASLLINKGKNILIVSQRLGHADITQTLNTYSHLMPNKQQEIIDALDIL